MQMQYQHLLNHLMISLASHKKMNGKSKINFRYLRLNQIIIKFNLSKYILRASFAWINEFEFLY